MNCRTRARQDRSRLRESGNNEVTTVDGNGNAASDENKTNTPDDVQVEPEQDGNNTLS